MVWCLFVDVCVGYGGVYVFYVFFGLCVCGVGICVDVCGAVCVVECFFLVWVLIVVLSCDVVVRFVLSVIRVVECVLLWVVCVFRYVSVGAGC